MKNLYAKLNFVLILSLIVIQQSVGQITILEQDFDSASSWGFESDIPFFDCDGGLDFLGVRAVPSALDFPLLSGNILSEQDLESPCGTSGEATISFPSLTTTTDISGYIGVSLSFDYDIVGYNANSDEVYYELFYNGVGQGRVVLQTGSTPGDDSEGSVNVNIPDVVNQIGLEIIIKNNGGSGHSGFDNFKLTGFSGGGNSCSISNIAITNAGACNDNGTATDVSDDYYMADVEITYSDSPASGTIDLTGAGVLGGTTSASVGTSVQTISGVQLKADGNDVEIIATFSDDSACNFTQTIAGSGVASCSSSSGGGSSPTSADAWINELHYDNDGGDVNEGVEIVIADESTFPLSEWYLILYNGSNGTEYGTIDYTSPDIQNTVGGFTIAWKDAPSSIQNGGPDGLALIHDDGTTETVVQFLSYEGSFTASGGLADGQTSTDIGVSETNLTPIGESLQLSGNGTQYSDFTWEVPAAHTRGLINNGQSFGTAAPNTEVQFSSASGSVAEDGGTFDLKLSILNEDASIATSVDVALTSGDAADIGNYTAQTVTFPAGSAADETVTLTITDNMMDEVDKNLTFTLQNVNGGNNAQIGTQNTFDLTILDDDLPPFPSEIIPYTEDFSDCATQEWSVFTLGAEQEWSCDASGYFEANAFGSSGAADDFLVSPEFDMDAQGNEILTFTSWTRFADASYPPISLLYTGNFTGDPTTTTWNTLNPTWSPENSQVSTASGDVDVSSVSGSSVVFAFRYTSTGTGGRSTAMWRIDDFELKENPFSPEPSNHVTDFTATANGENQIDLSWTDAIGTQLPDNYLIKISTTSITAPIDGTEETDDTDLSDGEGVLNVAQGVETASFMGLTASTQYFFEIYPYTNSGTGIDYKTDGTVPAEDATTDAIVPASVGWQIISEDTSFVIDFDNTVSGVNNGQFDGSGFTTAPAAGQLNSDAWAVSGLSDGSLDFGDTETSGDFSRGSSAGGVTSGGIYAFETSATNVSLGVQPGGSDFTSGSMTLKVQNKTGATVTDVDLEYMINIYNDQDRSSSFNFSYSTDEVTYVEVSDLDFSSPEVADGSPTWESHSKATSISGLSITDDDFIYLRWTSDDVSGSGSRDELSLDDIGLVFNPSVSGFIYSGGSWSPSNPVGSSTSSDEIQILDGTAVINGDLVGDNLIVNAGAKLEMAASNSFFQPNALKLTGDVTNDGNITFKSNVNGFSQFDEFNGIISGSGDVLVENFIPAGEDNRRAFRFVTSAVTTSNSIKMNWQEGVNNPDISTNLNPNPGYGTHISGSTSGNFGFDATISGNPSLFTFDNSTQQQWSSIDNTDTNTLDAGSPYRLFIRGDRSRDLNNNNTIPNNTTIRASGNLVSGSLATGIDLPALAQGGGNFSFLGNPYQAIVDFSSLNFIGDVNPNFLYLWDANASTQGAYVTIDTETPFPQLLIPGQSFFVVNSETVTSAPAIEFNESDKSSGILIVGPPNDDPEPQSISMAKANLELYDHNDSRVDIMKFRFEPGAENGIDDFDAPKLGNLSENLASKNNNSLLAIERRDIPESTEIVPLFINQYQTDQYEFRLETTNWDSSINVYIVDHYLNSETLIDENQAYNFNLDNSIPESMASDRFSLSFDNTTLSIDDADFGRGFSLYPNPTQNGSYTIKTNGLSGEAVVVKMHNMLGQEVFKKSLEIKSHGEVKVDASALPAGIYMVQLSQNNNNFNTKLIIQ